MARAGQAVRPTSDQDPVAVLDRDGSTPLYRQLKWLIRRGIDDGQYHAGDRLPSENEFARAYGVSRHLVRQALVSLVAEGRVVPRQGYGYYVNARRLRRELPVLTGYTAPMRQADPSSRVKVLRQELTSEPADVVAALGGRGRPR
jgi:DNA-binding GntR family transcriptional regulator